jgi:hypothetical protein
MNKIYRIRIKELGSRTKFPDFLNFQREECFQLLRKWNGGSFRKMA